MKANLNCATFIEEKHTVLQSHNDNLASENTGLVVFVLTALRKPWCSLLGIDIVYILMNESSVTATDFRCLNTDKLLVKFGTVFTIRDDKIKDHLKLKKSLTRQVGAVIQLNS